MDEMELQFHLIHDDQQDVTI